ncbi:hypothetical protein KCU73_g53, partial [Aureobasidium melanogenum]
MAHQLVKPWIGVGAFVAPFDIDRRWPSLPNRALNLLYLGSSWGILGGAVTCGMAPGLDWLRKGIRQALFLEMSCCLWAVAVISFPSLATSSPGMRRQMGNGLVVIAGQPWAIAEASSHMRNHTAIFPTTHRRTAADIAVAAGHYGQS